MTEGLPQRAAELLTDLVAERACNLGAEHPDTVATRASLAEALLAWGRPREAAELLRVVLEQQTRVLGAEHPDARATKRRLESLAKDRVASRARTSVKSRTTS